MHNDGLQQDFVFHLALIPQRLLAEPTHFRHRQIDLNLPNDEPALQHELVREIVATSSNTERTAIVIKEGKHFGHLWLANTLGVV